jgi:hypothetical protein
MKFTPFQWRNRGEGPTTPLDRQNLQTAELGEAKFAEELQPIVNAELHGLALDGVTDDGPALNALISELAAELGAGTGREAVIGVPWGKTLALGTTVERKPFVSLRGFGAHIKLLSAFSGGAAFTNSTAEGFARSDLTGFTIDKGPLEGILLDCHSMQYCKIDIKRMLGGTEHCTNLSLKCDGTVGVGGELKSNTVHNELILIDNGLCGFAAQLRGQAKTSVPGGEGAAVVTLNDFTRFAARNVFKGGIDFIEWADDNFFEGVTNIVPKGEGAFAVRINGSATPAADVGVYCNEFDYLNSECYGSATKRRGLILNYSHGTVVRNFFPEPLGPEGAAIANEHSQSHNIRVIAVEGSTVLREVKTPHELFEVGSVPSAPTTGFAKMYFKEKHLFVMLSDGIAKQVI